MKKIFNTALVIAAAAVIGMGLASCKAQEVYWENSANDFEFGDPVVIKVVTHAQVADLDERDLYKKVGDSYKSATYSDYAYMDQIKYSTFVPIAWDTDNNGRFDITVETKSYDVFVNTGTGGVWVTWTYKDDLNPYDSDDEDNVKATAVLKNEKGEAYYYQDGRTDSGYAEAKWTAAYKKPTASSVKFKVTATDSRNGTNQVEKELTVNYSENASKTQELYQTWYNY